MPCTEINNAINWSKQSTGTKTFPVTAYFTKHFGKVTAAALLALAGASASAAALGPLDLSSGSTGFSNTPIAGDFIDTYTFTLTRPTFLAGSVTSVVGGIQNVDFSDIRIVGPNTTFNFTKLNPDPFEFWVTGLPDFQLIAGDYKLQLLGTNSPAMGSYGGNIALRVLVVPEPQTLALLCGGLGVVGFLASRRKR